MPKKLKSFVLQTLPTREILDQLSAYFTAIDEEMCFASYKNMFRLMLHLKEIQHFHNIHAYDMERIHFFHEKYYPALMIENLSEHQPLLVIGDCVVASNPLNQKRACTRAASTKPKASVFNGSSVQVPARHVQKTTGVNQQRTPQNPVS